MAKARSPKTIVATFHTDHKALSEQLREQWPAIARSYCHKRKAASKAEQPSGAGDENEAAATQTAEWRAEVFGLTATCVDRTLIEATAPRADDAAKLINTIAWAAGELAKAIANAQGGELGVSIRSEIESRLSCREVAPLEKMPRYARDYPQVPMSAMLRYARDYARAANSAPESTAYDFSVVEGQAWDSWIAGLLKFARDNDLPTTVSPYSGFVQFVEILQGLLAAELARASEAMSMSHEDRARLDGEIARHKALAARSAASAGNLMRAIKRAEVDVKKRSMAQAEARRVSDAERQAEAERLTAEESWHEKERAVASRNKARLRHNRRLARRGQSPGTAGV